MVRKFFIRATIFTLILCIPLFFLSLAFDKKVPFSLEDKPFWVLTKSQEKYDYAVGGSSRAFNNADIRTMDSVLNLKGINIAFSGSALAENYLTLYLFLKNGNKINNYILQLDDWSLVNPDMAFPYPFHEYYFFPFMNDCEVCNVIEDNKPLIKYLTWKYLPFVKYAEFNNIFSLQNSYKSVKPIFDKDMGTERLIKKHKGDSAFKVGNAWIEHRLFRNNLKYLDKIIQLCKKERINLIFYTAPVYYKFFYTLKRAECKTCIDSVNAARQVKYLNFALDPNFKDTSLMYNETHLNREGTFLFSRILADSLTKYLKK